MWKKHRWPAIWQAMKWPPGMQGMKCEYLGKEMAHAPERVKQGEISNHHTQNGMQFKICEAFLEFYI